MKNTKGDYRSRIYNSYHSIHWKHFHSDSLKEHELYRRTARIKFNKYLPLDKDAKIIDTACGAGHFLYYIQKEGYSNAHGIDLSREMAETARKMGVVNVKQNDLFKVLPKNENKYDMIIANDIIEHLKKDEVLCFLDLIFSSLKPRGTLLLTTLNCQSLFGAYGPFMDFTHETGFTAMSLGQILRVCGYADITIKGEGPVAHDLKSGLRCMLWNMIKRVLGFYAVVEQGTGRGLKKHRNIFESRMFAVAKKPDEAEKSRVKAQRK